MTVINVTVLRVFELNLPFLVTGIGRVAEQGDAFLQQKCARHNKPGTVSLVVGLAFTKNQE